jgi:tetratricopeptide (TPR) repeat protein
MRRAWIFAGFAALGVAAVLFVVESAVAQELPRLSPKASVSQRIGLTDVTITYSRPGVKGRKIWGGLVPYNEVWRAGANEATTISLSDDATINGQKLKAGKYSLFTIPAESDWTIIFNSQADIWGTQYDREHDVLRIKVTPQPSEFVERMLFTFRNLTDNSADVVLQWEKLKVPFTIQVDVQTKALANARAAVAKAKPDDWRPFFSAANYCMQNNINHEEALEWIDQSIAANENFFNVSVKARLLAQVGRTADAIATAEKAMKIAEASDRRPNTAELEKFLNEWRAAKK